jgi:hypothetical protein
MAQPLRVRSLYRNATTTISPTDSGPINLAVAATSGIKCGCVNIAKIAKATAVSKPPLSPTVSAVIPDFVNKPFAQLLVPSPHRLARIGVTLTAIFWDVTATSTLHGGWCKIDAPTEPFNQRSSVP